MKRNLIVLGGIVLANYLAINAQSIVSGLKWHQFVLPESRYWIQSLILLLPFVPLLAFRFKHGRYVLGLSVGLCALTALAYTVKARVPGTRRYHQSAACEWAADYIRKDYRGPIRDAESAFNIYEYTRSNRPVVDAFSARVGLLLDGRNGAPMCGFADIPDYLVDEPYRFTWDWFAAAEYEKVSEKRFGRRTFQILKLKKRKAE